MTPKQVRSSLVLIVLVLLFLDHVSATTTPPPEETPRCNTADMVEVNSVPTVKKSIDFWNCDQNLVNVRAGALTTLINTLHESPSFVFMPSSGFEYFEVLFRRGTRATVFNTQKVSDVAPGQYIVRIVFKFVPPRAITPNLAVEIGITPLSAVRNSGSSNLNGFLDDSLWNGNPSLKKFTCMSSPEPRQLELSQVIIRVQGASEWQYIPEKDLCSPETSSSSSSNILPSDIPANSTGRNESSSDASRNFSDLPNDTALEPVTMSPSSTRSAPSRFPSTPTPPPYHPPTNSPHFAPTDQGPRGPRLITVTSEHTSTEEVFPSEGFIEDNIKNGTGTEVVRLSTPLISGIIGGLAIILLIIGCCLLFKNLNLRGTYGIHSNTYEAESSLHLRDSHYNANATDTAATAASPSATAASPSATAASPSATAASPSATAASSSATAASYPASTAASNAPSIIISEGEWQSPDTVGQVNHSLDMS